MELKKTNTLFHTLSEYNFLEQIILNKGFKASYADETISGMNVKILMVSFSNVALFESETQINYGKYSLGLKLEWGKLQGLQPVLYTYSESTMGSTFFENYFVSEKDQTILTALEQRKKQEKMDPAMFGLILDLKQISENSHEMLLYLKPDIVKNKKGIEFKSYNDREWRFICKNENSATIIFERSFSNGAWNTHFEEAKSFSKPFTSEPVLKFSLEDIKYIVVPTISEKKKIMNALFETFGKDKVVNQIIYGELDVLSRNSLWDDM
jgi:hypothetical protein